MCVENKTLSIPWRSSGGEESNRATVELGKGGSGAQSLYEKITKNGCAPILVQEKQMVTVCLLLPP
jgi:hypothetical protein